MGVLEALGGFGRQPQVTDRWMDLSSERKEDTCWQSNLKPKIACEEVIKGNTHTKPRGKDRKSEKGGNRDRLVASAATHPKREQNVPEVAKKLGFQPESGGWENRYGQCLFVALGVSYLSTHHLHVGLQGASST